MNDNENKTKKTERLLNISPAMLLGTGIVNWFSSWLAK